MPHFIELPDALGGLIALFGMCPARRSRAISGDAPARQCRFRRRRGVRGVRHDADAAGQRSRRTGWSASAATAGSASWAKPPEILPA
jgi:hypothetical protein